MVLHQIQTRYVCATYSNIDFRDIALADRLQVQIREKIRSSSTEIPVCNKANLLERRLEGQIGGYCDQDSRRHNECISTSLLARKPSK